MRIAGENERIDAERGIFLDPRGDGRRIADQRRAGAAANEPDAGPQVWADLKFVAPAAVQRRHSFLADGIHAGENRLRLGDRVVVEIADQVVRGLPRFLIGFAHDDMEPDAETQRAADPRRGIAYARDLFGDRVRRLAPGEIFVDGFDARGDAVGGSGG